MDLLGFCWILQGFMRKFETRAARLIVTRRTFKTSPGKRSAKQKPPEGFAGAEGSGE